MPNERNAALNTGDDESSGRVTVGIPAQLASLETQLARLQPRQDRLDRERIAFLAGQASVRPSRRWPAALVAMTSVAATLLCMWIAGSLASKLTPTDPKPESVASRANRPHHQEFIDLAPEERQRRTVLRASDAYDFEPLQSMADVDQPAPNASLQPESTSSDAQPRPVLTPALWRQLVEEEPKSTHPSTNDSASRNLSHQTTI
jgi:hypothetical protein